MAEHVLEFTDQNFDSEVLKADGLVVVDFWAPWCGPCRMLSPTIEALAAEYSGKVKVGKLNTDENRQVAISQDIKSLPTIRFFKNGQVVENFLGPVPKERLAEAMDSHVAAGKS